MLVYLYVTQTYKAIDNKNTQKLYNFKKNHVKNFKLFMFRINFNIFLKLFLLFLKLKKYQSSF